MNRKLVYRYYCDFCKRATCSASATSRHEKACTMNPNRVCRMCEAACVEQPAMQILITAAADDVASTSTSEAGSLIKIVRPARLAYVADNCPACILAAIRQLPPNDSVHFEWDFKEARKAFWDAINDAECGWRSAGCAT